MIHMLGKAFFAGFALFTAGWTVLAVYLARRSSRTRSWAETTGVVLSTAIERKESDPGPDIRVGYAITYEPRVRYRYSAAGRDYEGDRITHAVQPANPDEASARVVLSAYRTGSHVPVFYDPLNPADAVLVRGASAGNVYFIALGVVMLIASIAAFLFL